MAIKDSQTTKNIQEKASLIWNIADLIVNVYKPHEYGKVILPMTVLKRFNDCLITTHDKVVKKNKELEEKKISVKDAFLRKESGFQFYNTSEYTFEKMLSEDNIAENFQDFLNGFSDNVKDIISNFEFDKQIEKMVENGLLYNVIQEFNKTDAYMGPDKVTTEDMGYIFEELIRRFSESYDEKAGSHFTARDIIYLMSEILVSPEKEMLHSGFATKSVYDMTMGTSQMLTCLTDKIHDINENIDVTTYGQELNPETYAIAKAEALILGQDANNMKKGNTLTDDQFDGYEFDYIISNPPFGEKWKNEEKFVKDEYNKQGHGRFKGGLPKVSDGQILFMQNGLSKLKDSGRMAIIQNGSPLFNGDAGSGTTNLRKYLFENDLIDAIIELPIDLFYNTGITTYIWVLTKEKDISRLGHVQLINASKAFVRRRKPIGKKRVDIDDICRELIVEAYNENDNKEYSFKDKFHDIYVESKIFENDYFGYTKVCINTYQTDTDGKIVNKKGRPVIDKSLKDFEWIPLQENIDTYFEKEVLPFNKNAVMDRTQDLIGYEIPFVKIFYKFESPMSNKEIFCKIKELEEKEKTIMKGIMEDEQ